MADEQLGGISGGPAGLLSVAYHRHNHHGGFFVANGRNWAQMHAP